MAGSRWSEVQGGAGVQGAMRSNSFEVEHLQVGLHPLGADGLGVQEPIIVVETFEKAQALLSVEGRPAQE